MVLHYPYQSFSYSTLQIKVIKEKMLIVCPLESLHATYIFKEMTLVIPIPNLLVAMKQTTQNIAASNIKYLSF